MFDDSMCGCALEELDYLYKLNGVQTQAGSRKDTDETREVSVTGDEPPAKPFPLVWVVLLLSRALVVTFRCGSTVTDFLTKQTDMPDFTNLNVFEQRVSYFSKWSSVS